MKRYIIKHPDAGIFLGDLLGLSLWSNLDSNGLTAAPTFPTREAAHQFMASWIWPGARQCEVIPCHPDIGHHISVTALVSQGIGGWLHRTTKPANVRPL